MHPRQITPDQAVIHLARRMQAQGYPLDWQAAQTGHDVTSAVYCRPNPSTAERLARDLRALSRQLGEALATPRPGLTPDDIAAAKREAHAAGYYPPAAYDDDGNLIPGAVEGHRWEIADEIAARRLRILALLLAGTRNALTAEMVGVTRKTVDRVTSVINKARREHDRGEAWLANARTALELHEHDDENPTVLALYLHLISPRSVAKDHPAHARVKQLGAHLAPPSFPVARTPYRAAA